MKARLVKKLILFMIAVLGLISLLLGCASAEMSINRDGSGEIKYIIAAGGMVNSTQIKDEINKNIKDTNQKMGKDAIKLKKVTEKDGKIEATISFKSMPNNGNSSALNSLDSFYKKSPNKLSGMRSPQGQAVTPGSIKSMDKYTILDLEGLDSGGALQSLRVTVPGKIAYLSSNAILSEGKKDTAEMKGGRGYIVYEKSGGLSSILFYLAIILAVVVGGYLFISKTPMGIALKRTLSGARGDSNIN